LDVTNFEAVYFKVKTNPMECFNKIKELNKYKDFIENCVNKHGLTNPYFNLSVKFSRNEMPKLFVHLFSGGINA